VAIELIRCRFEQTAALGVGVDVDECPHGSRHIEDASRGLRIGEVALSRQPSAASAPATAAALPERRLAPVTSAAFSQAI
jgi:hypothetical protein